MGKTVPSYRMILEREIQKWQGFLNALRSDDKKAFEEMMNECRCHASAAGAATRPIVSDAMFMSILLSHQKTINQIQTTLERIKQFLPGEYRINKEDKKLMNEAERLADHDQTTFN